MSSVTVHCLHSFYGLMISETVRTPYTHIDGQTTYLFDQQQHTCQIVTPTVIRVFSTKSC
jgi:hypothetical protein